MNGNFHITGDLLPDGDNNHRLGNEVRRFRSIYCNNLHCRTINGQAISNVTEEDFLQLKKFVLKMERLLMLRASVGDRRKARHMCSRVRDLSSLRKKANKTPVIPGMFHEHPVDNSALFYNTHNTKT
jgi:hypothetical protein